MWSSSRDLGAAQEKKGTAFENPNLPSQIQQHLKQLYSHRIANPPPVMNPAMIAFQGSSFCLTPFTAQSNVENIPPQAPKFPPSTGALALMAATDPVRRSPWNQKRMYEKGTESATVEDNSLVGGELRSWPLFQQDWCLNLFAHLPRGKPQQLELALLNLVSGLE